MSQEGLIILGFSLGFILGELMGLLVAIYIERHIDHRIKDKEVGRTIFNRVKWRDDEKFPKETKNEQGDFISVNKAELYMKEHGGENIALQDVIEDEI